MINSGATRTFNVPHEPGEWVEVRLLGHTKLKVAREAQLHSTLQTARVMGGELMNELSNRSTEVREVATDPLAQYDQTVLLRHSVCRWSYPVPVTPESVDDLDPVTAEWLAREVAKLYAPRSEDESLKG